MNGRLSYNRGWIEAIIDGEGSISLLKEKRPHFKAGCTYKPRVNIANKNIQLIKKAQSLVGGCITQNKQTGVYNLDISANYIRKFLAQIHLIVKEKQRTLLLKALMILERRCGRSLPRTSKEIEKLEKVYQNIRTLNGKVWNKK